MIVMISNHDLDECERELGTRCEQIFTPQARHVAKRSECNFCIDNGAFAKFDETSFLSLLERERPRRDLCRWVAVPDVVGSARRTLEVFEEWKLRLSGWPLALVCQDGQEELPIPWKDIAAIFIGGGTEWKIGKHALACIKAAKAIGKWVHVGRVNTPGRFEYFEDLGVDSIDGTGLSRFPDNRHRISDRIDESRTSPKLPGIVEA